jgi:hypothetical protein
MVGRAMIVKRKKKSKIKMKIKIRKKSRSKIRIKIKTKTGRVSGYGPTVNLNLLAFAESPTAVTTA